MEGEGGHRLGETEPRVLQAVAHGWSLTKGGVFDLRVLRQRIRFLVMTRALGSQAADPE